MEPPHTSRHVLRRVYQMAAGRRDTPYWDRAWEHIKDHLSASAGRNKERHAVFHERYRSRADVAGLIMQAASKPSATEAGFLTGAGGEATGAPGFRIWRWFNQPIGWCEGKEIDTLLVVADANGIIVTAYPRMRAS